MIARFTEQTWNTAQAKKYVNEIESCCLLLAANPSLGRSFRGPRPNLRRMEQGSHVIFFIAEEKGIVVLRILHKGMMPGLREFE
jgi:toxin ParE1/3/4